jgi:hypothetical protein
MLVITFGQDQEEHPLNIILSSAGTIKSVFPCIQMPISRPDLCCEAHTCTDKARLTHPYMYAKDRELYQPISISLPQLSLVWKVCNSCSAGSQPFQTPQESATNIKD